MKNSDFFKREIANINNEEMRHFVEWYFNTKVGAWFWTSGASASGKFHPVFTRGEGGLVRHTRAAALILEELLRLNTYAYMNEEFKDLARVAILLHDTCKYGTQDKEDHDFYRNHGKCAANCVAYAWECYFNEPCSAFLYHAIASHMGQWVEDKEDKPFTPLDRLVHLADYIASRSFIDIPCISEEYKKDIDNDLPF